MMRPLPILTRNAVFMAIVALSFSSAWADVAIRADGNSDVVAPGEVKYRATEAFPPNPYVNTALVALSLVPMLEAPKESWDVMGLRLSLLVGSHRAVAGLDLGVLGNFSDYKMNGLAISTIFNSLGESDGALHIAGIFNFVAFDYTGFQLSGFFSCTEGTHTGVQIALGNNYAGHLIGLQIGLFNVAERGEGVQVGLCNYSEQLKGLQVGLLNVNYASQLPCLPIVNVSF